MTEMLERILKLHDNMRDAAKHSTDGLLPDLLVAAGLIAVAEQLEGLRSDLVAGNGRIVVTIENTDYPIGVQVTKQ